MNNLDDAAGTASDRLISPAETAKREPVLTATPRQPCFGLNPRGGGIRAVPHPVRGAPPPRRDLFSLFVDDKINLALNQIAIGRQNSITHVIAARRKRGSAHVHIARRLLLRRGRKHGALVVLQVDR